VSFAVAELDRRVANLNQVGRVVGADAGTGRVRVAIGELQTPWLPVQMFRAGALNFAMMPSVGEQVHVVAPGGDMARAFVGGGIPAGNLAGQIAEEPTVDLGGGKLVVVGDLHVTGTITCDTDVVADGISLVTHVHEDVAVGNDDTGEPKR
jgi:phage baseplate assembly protein gpV